MRKASVVIPVKHSRRTIGATVSSLLAQDYAGPIEIIVVGDPGDESWGVIPADPRVRCIELAIATGGRDSNAKRNAGLAVATGDVLCLTDSDMVLPADWLSTGVALLDGCECVAGPMISVHRDFWGRYVDVNPIGSKTPRMDDGYVLDGETLGRGRKLPITANVLFTRRLYERVGGLDPEFVHSYEDYEFFQRVVDAGARIRCTPRLAAWHHHRQGWRALVREYHRSGRGCAQFVGKHPHSPFASGRLRQLEIVCTAAVFLPVALAVMPAILAALLVLAVALSAACAARARMPQAAAFPAVTLVLGVSFTTGLLRGLRAGPSRPMHHEEEAPC